MGGYAAALGRPSGQIRGETARGAAPTLDYCRTASAPLLEVGAARRCRALSPRSDWFRSRALARLFAAAGGGLHGHANQNGAEQRFRKLHSTTVGLGLGIHGRAT
jgi:hypothetical protein